MIEVVRPESLPGAPGFSWGIRTPQIIVTSGVVAIDERMEIVSEDVEIQAEICLRRLVDIIEAGGGALRNIVKVTCYALSQAAAHAYMRKKAEIFGDHAPAATVIVVAELLMPGAQLEIEAIAVR